MDKYVLSSYDILISKWYTELWRNEQSIYLVNLNIEMWVLLINNFSFRNDETNAAIKLFDEMKVKHSFIEKSTIWVIHNIDYSNMKDWDTEEVYTKKVFADQYFFLKIPVESIDMLWSNKGDFNVIISTINSDSDYNNLYNRVSDSKINAIFNDNNTAEYYIDPFSEFDWVAIRNFYEFLFKYKDKDTLYIHVPAVSYDHVYYVRYITQKLTTGNIKIDNI